MQAPKFNDRETARAYFVETIASQTRAMQDPRDFATYPRTAVIEFCERGLRWIDCAPEGANHLLAPMQDKQGVPCGGAWNENVGPGKNLREARIARGRDPRCSALEAAA